MPVLGLDHINIAARAPLLARCRDFYVAVLGLTEGYRPPFRSRGYWLYAGGRPVVHLSERDAEAEGSTGPVDHFALSCDGKEAMVEQLERHAVSYEIRHVPMTNRDQIFLEDPAGVHIELNFPAG